MSRPKHHLLMLILTSIVTLTTSGCATGGNDSPDDAAPRIGDTRISFSEDDDALPVRQEIAVKQELPGDAVPVEDPQERELTHEADTSGFIYVFDETDNRIVYSGHLRRGERFVLDRESSRAMIDGVVVYAQERDEDRDYRIYFDRD
jgi:hypothetical protein